MQKENTLFQLVSIWILIIIAGSLGVMLIAYYNAVQSLPLHATIETTGSFIALFLAFFLFKFDDNNHILTRFHYSALALIGMGGFELFHAMCPPGTLFVWYHTIGLFIGSILFLGVWLPEKQVSRTTYYMLPFLTTIVFIVIALFLFINSETLPPAIVQGHFSENEIILNNISGVGFFLAAFYFLHRYRVERDGQDLYFIALTLMLGSAALLFQFSVVWGEVWWFWHFIRLGGLFFVLLYFIRFISEKNIQFKEIEIQAEKLKFFTTFEQAAVGIAHVAPDGSWLRVNQKLCDIVGYTHEELIAATFQDITHPDDLQADLEYVNEMLRRERNSYVMRKRYIRKDGSIVWIDLTVSLVWKEDQTPDFFISVIVDVNEEVKAKEEIRTLNAELEHKVIERTAALQNAYDEMEAFTYSVSHDLRSPLRATDGFSQALLEDYSDQLDATAQDYLSRIRSASQKMGGLIDDLLQLSRQTRTAMVPSSIDLGVIARQIISELSRQSPKRQVDFTIHGDVNAYADANLMHIVLDNLLGNAWKYTSLHKDATIEFGSTLENGEKVFYIRDDGAGFNMDYVDKLFKPFQRLHTVQDFPGNGIGLAMVYRIIKRHFGRVWAQGEIEKGATFFFTLGLSASTYQPTKEQS